MIRKIVWWFSFFLIISFLIYLISFISIYTYSSKNETRKADAIIVLGAAVWYNKPSPAFQRRIDQGITLYKEGYASKVIFTGGKYDEETPSESSIAKKYAIKHGVKASDIYIEEKSRATEQNLKYAKEIMDKNNLYSALIVSDPFHMKRSMIMASLMGIQGYTSPTPHTFYKAWKSKVTFINHESLSLASYILSYPIHWVDWHFFDTNNLIMNDVRNVK